MTEREPPRRRLSKEEVENILEDDIGPVSIFLIYHN